MSTHRRRYIVVDRHAHVAAELRPQSTAINPRYLVRNAETREIVDEFSTKRIADLTARDLNALTQHDR